MDLLGHTDPLRLAILYPGDQESRRRATTENSRFADLFRAFAAEGVLAEPAVYHDECAGEVHQRLLGCDGVLVWVNPIEGGRDRSVLDSLLREVASGGVFVSTHPDVILKLGTKEVLFRTREIGWGCDTHLYRDLDQMRRELPLRLAAGKARVLKQNRGNGGDGVWRVQLARGDSGDEDGNPAASAPALDTVIRARHAKRGAVEEQMPIGEFCARCEVYFRAVDGRMIDQEYQERLPEGMIRCYLVHDRVAGFGHQAVNALFPAPSAAAREAAPQPGPRYYHPPHKPEFQDLKRKVEDEWVPATQRLLNIERESLPVLWDC
ncbi:MAG: Cj0069 family protein, partial [Myxococcales bacterium]|nr:Cj0069 family protein [Myxococcales bacterium]